MLSNGPHATVQRSMVAMYVLLCLRVYVDMTLRISGVVYIPMIVSNKTVCVTIISDSLQSIHCKVFTINP